MNVQKITQPLSSFANTAASKIGETLKDTKATNKIIKAFEPNGGDNSFFGLASIMVLAVLIPRISTALKRNPDNKEATMDEVKEILFRDLQTILIMLFGLKSLNSVIGNISTKMTGLPMVDKPLDSIFQSKKLPDKVNEFLSAPVEKFKTMGKNVLKVLNPIGGSTCLSDSTIKTMYSNYGSVEEVQKFLKDLPEHGGNSEKVFEKIKNAIIKSQEDVIANIKKNSSPDVLSGKISQISQENIANAQENIKYFEKLKYGDFMDKGVDNEGAKTLVTEFFADKDNALAHSATVVNSWLRTLALGIEVVYLGFGLPALNQKRLEKKYLGEKPIGTQQGDTFCPINDRHIKAQEVKLYGNFIR